MGFNNTLPTSGVAVGDIWHLGNGVATYVSDVDGLGTPGWIVLGGTISLPRGMQVPVVLTQPSSPRIGEMIWNDGPATPVLQVYDGSGWVTIGP